MNCLRCVTCGRASESSTFVRRRCTTTLRVMLHGLGNGTPVPTYLDARPTCKGGICGVHPSTLGVGPGEGGWSRGSGVRRNA